MDRENRVIEESKAFIPFIQEEFLISASNKGIYKRSLKDLEKARDSITMIVKEEGTIEAKIEDTTVILNPNIQKSSCTCPSSSVCKHIIMALLFLKEYHDKYVEEENKEETEKVQPTEEYEALKNLTIEQAMALIGKKDYQSLMRSILMKKEAQFEYGDLLTVNIVSQNSKVYFPKENSIENAMCSCKEKGICKHKAYALLSYLIENKIIGEEENIECGIEIGRKEEDFLIHIQEYIGLLLDTGLSSLTENEMKKTEKFYIQAYGMKFFSLATEIKNLSSELNFYFSKNVSFSNKRMLHNLCGIYNRASGLLATKEDGRKRSVLAGQRREESYYLDNIAVTGLGAVCRLTKRNDLLITAYFYCQDLNSMLSMSTLRPLENNNSITPEYLYKAGMVWSDEISFMLASTSHMILKNARLTSGKISTTKATVCQIKGESTENDILGLAITDYSELKDKLKKRSFRYFGPYSETDTIFLVKVEKIEQIKFDKISQNLFFTVYDAKENTITFEIKYNTVTETAIKYLENKRNQQPFQYILGSITEKNDTLKGSFLSGMSEGKIKNIFFKQEDRYGRRY